ncbi:hypothetical protein E2542_SST03263 [Spatholobus suberectus]|nr:hypothetical protein E2542_SST03263 [Spatholobus suberectus]
MIDPSGPPDPPYLCHLKEEHGPWSTVVMGKAKKGITGLDLVPFNLDVSHKLSHSVRGDLSSVVFEEIIGANLVESTTGASGERVTK